MKPRGKFKNKKEGFIGYNFDIPGSGIRLEVLVPLDPSDESNFLVRFLRNRGPGIHHLTLHVESIPKLREALERIGVETHRDNDREIVIHPKTENAGKGVMWQYFGMHPWCPRCRAYKRSRMARRSLAVLTMLTTVAAGTHWMRKPVD